MFNLESELAEEYLAECRSHLADVETDLLALEKGRSEVAEQLVDRIFRAIHSVKGGAGVFDLLRIRELAHGTEDVLVLMRSGVMAPTPERVGVLLLATDRLLELIQNPVTSNQADLTKIMMALAGLSTAPTPSAGGYCNSEVNASLRSGGSLRVLLVEDDFVSRLVLQTFLTRYGECHIAVNGREAVEAFRSALQRGESYDLICMDIMMPEMDGREAVRQVRNMEEAQGILSTYGVKIIMTTAVNDIREVIRCFRELCDAYLVKPIDLAELLGQMRTFQLVQ